MSVGNFSEVLGTNGFDSIRGEDLSIVYALDDRDNLNSTVRSTVDNPTTIVVGGTGDNNYISWKDSTIFILENSDTPDNIFYTNIAGDSGISLEDGDSFVAEIDDRHLYLGNTQTGQYIVIIDWQLPENQIETFALSEGDLSYEEFVDSFRDSDNYRGNFTWAELAETEEIDLDRLGLSTTSEGIDEDFETIEARSKELSFIASSPLSQLDEDSILKNPDGIDDFLFGDAANNTLRGGSDSDTIFGDEGNDLIYGNDGDDILGGGVVELDPDSLAEVGGRDTLLGGADNDTYVVSQSDGGGSTIKDRIDPNDTDVLFIVAEDTDTNTLLDVNNPKENRFFSSDEYLEQIAEPDIFGDAALEISRPEAGIMGMQKSGTNLIIDLDRNGIAETTDDLTIFDFFNKDGELGKGSMTQINNIIDPQEIVDFF